MGCHCIGASYPALVSRRATLVYVLGLYPMCCSGVVGRRWSDGEFEKEKRKKRKGLTQKCLSDYNTHIERVPGRLKVKTMARMQSTNWSSKPITNPRDLETVALGMAFWFMAVHGQFCINVPDYRGLHWFASSDLKNHHSKLELGKIY